MQTESLSSRLKKSRNPWVVFALVADLALVVGVWRIPRKVSLTPPVASVGRVLSPQSWRGGHAGVAGSDGSAAFVRVRVLQGSAALGDVTTQWALGSGAQALRLTARSGAFVAHPWIELNGQRVIVNGDFRFGEARVEVVNGLQICTDSRGLQLRFRGGNIVNERVSLADTLGSLWEFEVIVTAFLTLLGSHLALLASVRSDQQSEKPFVQKFLRWCALLGAFLVGAIALAVWKVKAG